jgi:hypothetical protein
MESWVVGPIATNSRGAKSAQILAHGQPPVKRLGTAADPLQTPFGASNWDGNSRHTIEFNIPKPEHEWLEQLDAWAKKKLLKESPRFFKRQLSEKEVAQIYQSVIKKHEKDGTQYPDTVRCKFTVSRLNHWGVDHKPRGPPADYKFCDLVPMIQVKNFYFGTNQVGLVLELTDLLVQEQVRECPF